MINLAEKKNSIALTRLNQSWHVLKKSSSSLKITIWAQLEYQ